MEAPNIRIGRIGGNWSSQLLTSRRGALSVAAAAAVIAGVLIYLFVQHYRKAPVAAATPSAIVFVATHYIPPGTPEQAIAAGGMLRRETVPLTQAVAGAISDPGVLTGEVSTAAIAAGQQVSVGSFTKPAIAIGANLTGDQRAIALALDPTHGLTTYLIPGATVDIMVDDNNKTTMIAQNVQVLANQAGDIVVQVTDKQALMLAGTSDKAKIWLTLRPATGAKQSVTVGDEVSNL